MSHTDPHNAEMLLPLQRWNNFVKSWEPKGLFQFEITLNIFVSSF